MTPVAAIATDVVAHAHAAPVAVVVDRAAHGATSAAGAPISAVRVDLAAPAVLVGPVVGADLGADPGAMMLAAVRDAGTAGIAARIAVRPSRNRCPRALRWTSFRTRRGLIR